MIIICRNCGAKIDASDTECPYCHALQYDAAEKEYMKDLYHAKDTMGNLDDEAKKLVRINLMQKVGITVGAVVIALLIGIFAGYRDYMEIYNDADDQKRAVKNVLWYDENIDALNQYYTDGDYEAAHDLIATVQGRQQLLNAWEHYSFIELYYNYGIRGLLQYKEIIKEKEQVSEYEFNNAYEGALELIYGLSKTDLYKTRAYENCSAQDKKIVQQWEVEARAFLEETIGLTEGQYMTDIEKIYTDGYVDYEKLRECREKYYQIYEGR